jgi:hypothetical protein
MMILILHEHFVKIENTNNENSISWHEINFMQHVIFILTYVHFKKY